MRLGEKEFNQHLSQTSETTHYPSPVTLYPPLLFISSVPLKYSSIKMYSTLLFSYLLLFSPLLPSISTLHYHHSKIQMPKCSVALLSLSNS